MEGGEENERRGKARKRNSPQEVGGLDGPKS